jgi:tetratricopeptide (TPR) repeat protein
LTLGDAHSQAKNYQRAIELYEAALILRPPSTALLNALGLCYAGLGDSGKALGYFERSLALEPNQEPIKDLVGKMKTQGSPSRPND